jgi:hypothetical protein
MREKGTKRIGRQGDMRKEEGTVSRRKGIG